MLSILINLHDILREQLTLRFLMDRNVTCNLLQLLISLFTIGIMPKVFEYSIMLGGEKHQTEFFFITLSVMVIVQCFGFILPEKYKKSERFRNSVNSFFRRFV